MRESCLNAFNSYVDRYDVSDERIALKVEHTYEVAELCDEIARGEGLSPADVDLAWLCGLLHDIGRFEQLRQWGTFSDADSCSHAALGIQVLKDEMGSFTGDPERAHIIERAVALHSDFRLPSGLSARERLFCTITRDADKVDIMRVFNQSSCEAVSGIDPSEFSRGEISDVSFEAFGERRCLARDERPGSLDGLVGAVCLAFELELPASRKALGDRGYPTDAPSRALRLEPAFRVRAHPAPLGRHLRCDGAARHIVMRAFATLCRCVISNLSSKNDVISRSLASWEGIDLWKSFRSSLICLPLWALWSHLGLLFGP